MFLYISKKSAFLLEELYYAKYIDEEEGCF